jgi:hypothetical protein
MALKKTTDALMLMMQAQDHKRFLCLIVVSFPFVGFGLEAQDNSLGHVDARTKLGGPVVRDF